MKLLLILVMTGVILLDYCESSFWDHNHGPGPGPPQHRPKQMPRMDRDRPRPLRHHRHIQAHNYHRPIPRIHRPMPPPGHGRRSPRPPPRHGPIKSYRPPVNNNNHGSMFLQPMNQQPQRQSHRQHFSGPPAFFKQDEILTEQSTHFPSAVVPNEPHTSPSFQRTTEIQPHGYLSSTYKGWKPIVKPYQNSYQRPNKQNQKEEYSRKQEPHHHNSIDNVRSNSIQHTNLNLNTLFRENTDRLKSMGIQSDYSEHQGVRVALPPEVGRPVRLPQSFFMDAPWNTQYQSQSEDIPVIKKPFPKFHPKLKSAISALPNPPPINNDNGETRPSIPKFKFNRPRPRPMLKDVGHGNEPEISNSSPKSPISQFTTQSEEISNSQPNQTPLNLKAKLNSRGRVRVRTKVVKPYSQESEEQGLPPPRPLQPFDESRTRAPLDRPNLENSTPESQPGPPYPSSPNNRGPHNNGVRNYTEGAYSSSYPKRGNQEGPPRSEGNYPERNHPETNHRERNRPEINQQENSQRIQQPEFYGRPVANNQFHQLSKGPPLQKIESELKLDDGGEQKNPGGGRRRRPKGGNKNVAVQQQTTVNNEGPTSPTFTDDFYFPPGFSPDPSKNTGQHPVSFMTMPGSKPQVIHHTYENHRPQTQQQLYPINVIRSPDSEYQRPNHDHGTNPNGNYIPNNRPRFVIMNGQNGGRQSHSENSGFHNNNQHNIATAYPSNHESTYAPHGYGLGSNISPYTLSTSFPSPPNRYNQMTYPSPTPAIQHYVVPRRPQHAPPQQSTTMRNPYFQQNSQQTFAAGPYEMSPTMNSFEVSESRESTPYLSSPGFMQSTSPNSFQSTSPRSIFPPPPPPRMHHQQQQQQLRPQQTANFPQYASNFGSAEYDKIPMQYADQLRPILRDEPVEFSSTTPGSRHSHQSPEVHPPPNFFSDFFKPFDDNFIRNPEQDLDPKPSIPVRNQIRPPPYVNMDYEPYKSQSSSHLQVVPHPVTGSSFAPTARPSYSYSPQLYEGSSSMIPSSVSSTHKMDYDEITAQPSKSWSKKLQPDDGVSSTENIIRSTSATHHHSKKIGNKVNQKKQQQMSSPINSEVEPTKTRSRRPYTEIEENIPAVTTYKPSQPSSSKKVDSNSANEGNSRRDRVSNSDSTLPLEDDLNDSNTPRSVRARGKDKPDLTTTRVATESPEDSIPSTTFKSKRQFRRRRPEALVRRRYFSSRVKPEADSDEEKVDTTTLKPQTSQKRSHPTTESSSTIDENEDGYTPSRFSVLRHRRLYHRRKIPIASQRQREVDEKPSTSTPSSTEAESVTYGESQWFRIKPADSSSIEEPIVRVTKQETQTSKSILKSMADKGKYKSKILSSPVELVPLESTTTEVSMEELDRTPFTLKHSALKEHRNKALTKDSSSKKSMK